MTVVNTLKSVSTGSVRSRVTESLRKAVLSGMFLPGDALRELQLARQLGVSQASVREALLELERGGLVTRIANKGTFVTKLTKEELYERLSIRAILEGVAGIEAAKKMTSKDFRDLERRHQVYSTTKARQELYEAAEADLEFHRLIWTASGNRTLGKLLEQLTAPIYAFTVIVRALGVTEDQYTLRHPQHEAVISSLRNGNPDEIRETIRQHTFGSYELFMELNLDEIAARNPPGKNQVIEQRITR